MGTRKNQLTLATLNALFLILLLSNPRRVESGFKPPRAHVSIVNDLRQDLDLTVHCKSKKIDLGVQVIPFGGNFSFVFRPNIFGTTLYFCGFQWKFSTLLYFDIYKGFRDRARCDCSDFHWKIKPPGPCMFDHVAGKFDFCYPWNKH